MEDEKFKHDLDELFKLFKKLVETQSLEDVPGVDGMMLKQFQFFFSNYENMKDQIGTQLQGQFGEPVKQMISDLVKQLREQLGEDEFVNLDPDEPVLKIDSPSQSVGDIDKLLKNPNLTEDQINELLDRRAELI
ncbi:MAG: hypothetical protein H8E34_09850 [Bacteroidetes bacterium]|nr:hypothetical protein [Bacteroidota bacterium]MBL6942759.1 hypothetical protein [Bacteroidales bacterium]